jgi:prevent-host-death family protein
VTQLKARRSEYLRQVKGGSEIVVTERGVPVARLAPLEPEQRRATRLDRLMRAGVVRAPRSKLPTIPRSGVPC